LNQEKTTDLAGSYNDRFQSKSRSIFNFKLDELAPINQKGKQTKNKKANEPEKLSFLVVATLKSPNDAFTCEFVLKRESHVE
jgi:hypothetical protein